MREKIWINGISAETLSAPERGFRFGDGLFETMGVCKNRIPLLDFHIKRILQDAEYLAFELPELDWHKTILSLIDDVNPELTSNAVLNLWLWRAGGGRYQPQTNECQWVVRIQKRDIPLWEEPMHGLKLGIETRHQKAKGRLSNIKSCNGLLYVLASELAVENQFDDVLICNTEGAFLESSNSNLFALIDNKILTPPLADGCLKGVMREWLIHHASDLGLEIELRPISKEDLKAASEIWLTNAISGIRWVETFEGQEYGKQKALEIQSELQNRLKG